MDSRGVLVLSGWTPGWIPDLANTRGLTSELISAEDRESCPPTPPGAMEELPTPSSDNPIAVPDSDVDQSSAWDTKSGLEPIPVANLESTPLPCTAEGASGVLLRVDPAYGQTMNPEELSHLNEILDRIQSLSISNSSVYDKIGLKADDQGIYIPPTTHLVATVDDLTDMLDYDEETNMDEDVGSPTDNTMPPTNT